ncbi:MAG: phosphoribosylformylglycinamidine synthase [Bacteroidales bacterium]|nr:phosphoribosylformylglycinamidine synthase [Bacteroidales bacterium]
MILFFGAGNGTVIAVKAKEMLSQENINALQWLFGNATLLEGETVSGNFVGPRREMITPWSTTAVEITQNMNICGIERIEEFFAVEGEEAQYDKMLQRFYRGLDQEIFTIDKQPDPVIYIEDFESYNKQEGLALNPEEIEYLKGLSKKLGRGLTDSEVFGFSQVNSEHCRHKIFNGVFIIDGKEMESSLFKMIKKTSQENPNLIVSAYKDNCAFLEGPKVAMFHPVSGSKPSEFVAKEVDTVISLKAETHNFPTTVEPFNGAATGSGGEIRDRIAGGKGSFPIAGTACYMTSYPRFNEGVEATAGINAHLSTQAGCGAADLADESCAAAMAVERDWEKTPARPWLYQSPQEILTKASNGASDFGNKFGQCIICGSLLTAEFEAQRKFGFDKVIMLAGGVGYAKKRDALKEKPAVGDKVVLLGGDNYRIGMGGGAVSSVDTGQYANAIELNAIQRSNPEMQKRAYNAIRAIAESDNNTIISVHDHGAGGHLNCLSELVEETGGNIDISKLPVGDPTLSLKEIIGNESQERMGLVMQEKDIEELKAIADRERSPMYVIGETTGEHNFTLRNEKTGEAAIDLAMEDMFGSAPKTYMKDVTADYTYAPLAYDPAKFEYYVGQVLQLESVACKDWLTNKVDRSVTGLIAGQQTCGEIQLPLNNLGVTAVGYNNKEGIATSMGHAPMVAMVDSAAGSRMAISEALTNVVWAPLKDGIKGISLSANWMWPCRNEGEDTRLFKAVKGASDFSCALGINIPTGKDSMSMTQKYPSGEKVLSPGTVIISTVAPVEDINKIVHPNLQNNPDSVLMYIPFVDGAASAAAGSDAKEAFPLGGSAFAQIVGQVGNIAPDVENPAYFASAFAAVQKLVADELVLAGHDISAGGLITTALEMCFANVNGGLAINARALEMIAKEWGCAGGSDSIFRALFSETPGVLVQVASASVDSVAAALAECGVKGYAIGNYLPARKVVLTGFGAADAVSLDIDAMRDVWFKTSYLFDIRQVGETCAKERFQNYKKQPLVYSFPAGFTGSLSSYSGVAAPVAEGSSALAPAADAPMAAIIREKGSNGDREMAWALHLAGFRVKDVHMTDLISGRETLEEVKMIVFVGGFSNADTLGSAKGWAGAFLYNAIAKAALDAFYAREDTMSLGICNGCQLMAELGLLTPTARELSPKMVHNNSHKYESAFVGVGIENSPSIMLRSLSGSKLGIWVAHGEGKFSFPAGMDNVVVAARYTYNAYPANPNGSPEGIAGVCSTDGRHLAMMPHPERCLRPWNWAHYPAELRSQEITPWIEMFINARVWCSGK